MIHAYDKLYLEKARIALGRMLDFAVHDLKFDIDVFFDMFIQSGVAKRFETGDFAIIAGMSGVEIAYTVLEQCGVKTQRIKPKFTVSRSKEFWTGWALAYYQWLTSLRFVDIVKFVPIEDISALYHPYHEMDIRQFVDKMNEMYTSKKPEANLKLLRKEAGLTQRTLSDFSGVPLRTIQQYEQKQKNINNAQAKYLVMMSKVLCCEVEDLMEKTE